MQIVKHKCRICQKVTKQGNLTANHEFKLPEDKALLQCLECGVMGIETIEVINNESTTCG